MLEGTKEVYSSIHCSETFHKSHFHPATVVLMLAGSSKNIQTSYFDKQYKTIDFEPSSISKTSQVQGEKH